jgi:23S rRNA-/tRNA-specific pseudouridylate synthase
LVLCSADPAQRAAIGNALSNGTIEKTYLTLVHGRTRKKGVVRRPLQDGRRSRKLSATTRYRTLEVFERTSLLAVHIETGRKHQIRRHLHGIGHPIVGDERYRPRRKLSVPAFPGRLWLHAAQLILPDGTTVTAPLPEALLSHLDTLRQQLT